MATPSTPSMWPTSAARREPVVASQIPVVQSLLAVASHVPSGLIATAFTAPV
jgi:hypothetical protein